MHVCNYGYAIHDQFGRLIPASFRLFEKLTEYANPAYVKNPYFGLQSGSVHCLLMNYFYIFSLPPLPNENLVPLAFVFVFKLPCWLWAPWPHLIYLLSKFSVLDKCCSIFHKAVKLFYLTIVRLSQRHKHLIYYKVNCICLCYRSIYIYMTDRISIQYQDKKCPMKIFYKTNWKRILVLPYFALPSLSTH